MIIAADICWTFRHTQELVFSVLIGESRTGFGPFQSGKYNVHHFFLRTDAHPQRSLDEGISFILYSVVHQMCTMHSVISVETFQGVEVSPVKARRRVSKKKKQGGEECLVCLGARRCLGSLLGKVLEQDETLRAAQDLDIHPHWEFWSSPREMENH